jgi:hypothetical protein
VSNELHDPMAVTSRDSGREAGSAPETVWALWRKDKYLTEVIFLFELCPSSKFQWSSTFRNPVLLPSSGKGKHISGEPFRKR